MPFIAVASDFDLIRSKEYYSIFFEIFSFKNDSQFIIAFGIVLIFFYLFRGGINLFYYYSLSRFAQTRYHLIAYRLFKNYMNLPYQNFINKNSSAMTKTIVTEAFNLSGVIFAVLFIDVLHYYFNIHISTIVQNTYEFILDIFKFIKDFLFRAFGIDQVIDNSSSDNGSSVNGSSVNGSSVNEPILDEEVFHIPGNKYTFTEADGLCKAFGARLASYDEIESAYNKGGEWCSYGWSEGQMAYFPTQKSTFNELQKYPEQKNNCGRPGVNGGYMANPYIKFGVNCYGMKPDMKNKDEKYMKASETRVHNTNNGSTSQNTDNVIVAGFNTTDWNQFQRM